MRALLA